MTKFSTTDAAPASSRMYLPVDSTAYFFSPGNWSGDEGRRGKLHRQTWNPGAYFRVSWSTPVNNGSARLRFDTSGFDSDYEVPQLILNLNGIWTANVSCTPEVVVGPLTSSGPQVLTVYLSTSVQRDRWGTAIESGKNVVRLIGLEVDAGSLSGQSIQNVPWALIIGDSITEGNVVEVGGTNNLAAYSGLLGQALQQQGMEYGISACGWSGWLHPGDGPPGDVPAYFYVSGSRDGVGGIYNDAASRWNKIDGKNSLLDRFGRLSAYGEPDQEPELIFINYGTNEALHGCNPSDTQASVTQSLKALRTAAPQARIFLIIPFSQYMASEIKNGVQAYLLGCSGDDHVRILDLGPEVARGLDNTDYWGGVHPNHRAHAVFAARILAMLMEMESLELGR